MKAVIYARYSSDNQREESIEGRIRECTFNRKEGTDTITFDALKAFPAGGKVRFGFG